MKTYIVDCRCVIGIVMAGWRHPSWDKVFAVLGDGTPKTHRMIAKITGLSDSDL